jgi:DNA-binding CsgD family transcriptional regulator
MPAAAAQLRTSLSRQATAGALGAAAGLAHAVLDAIDVGLVMTGRDADLLHANRTAMRACEAGLPLSLSGGRLHATGVADQPKLAQALLAAAQGRRTMLSFRRADWTFTAGVVPLLDRHTGQQAVLFVFGDQPDGTRLNLQFLSQSYRLTLAESAVLSGLAQGLNPSQIARRGNVTIATVRSQITAIRGKTQTASIAQLLQLVASLPPLACAGTLDN